MATKKLTIASGKASGTNSNMPLLLVPSEVANIGSITLAEAQSGRFYTDSSLVTEVAREVVSSDELHFKGTSVSSASEFWFDYDGIRADYAVTDTYGRNAVWSDAAAVFHFQTDATESAGVNTGTPNTSAIFNSVSPAIGQGADLTTNNRFIDTTDTSFPTGNSARTVSFWLNNYSPNVSSRHYAFAYGTYSNNQIFAFDTGSSFESYDARIVGFNNDRRMTGVRFNDGGKYLIHLTHNGTTVRCYVNGSQVFSTNTTYNTGTTKSTIGAWGSGGGGTGEQLFQKAEMDEFRVLTSARSADWIATEYQNQNDNGAFWEAEDAGGGGGGWNAYPIIHMLQFNCVM